jgi:hypothetical protein
MKDPARPTTSNESTGFTPTGPAEVSPSARSISTHPRKRPPRTRVQLAALNASESAITARLEQTLNAGRCRVALISRAGSNLSRFRFEGEAPTFTHTGFAVREKDGWCVYQMLNIHGGAEGHLFRQPLAAFYRDDPYEYRCGVLAPGHELQERIEATLRSPLANQLHSSRYSRLAYPFAERYQNSNQWIAEIIGAAQSGRRSRRGIQDYLRRQGLPPTVLRAPGYLAQSTFALFSSNTRFDDHPLRSRLAGRIAFLTETSIRHHLHATDELMLNETVQLEAPQSRIPAPHAISGVAYD